MRINRAEAVKLLRLIKPGIAKRVILEQTDAYLFLNDRVITYNDKVSMSAPFPAGLQGAVSAPELYELLERATAAYVDVTFDDERVYIKCGTLEADIKRTKEILLPIENVDYPEPDDWLNLTEDFKKTLKQCLVSVGRSWHKPILRCVHWRGNILEATDNYRIIRCTIDVHLPDGLKILIDRSVISELIKYNPIAFAFANGWAHFKIEDGAVFSCRVFEGSFPNLEPSFSGEYVPIPLPTGRLADIMDRAIQFAKKDSLDQPHVIVSIIDNYLTVEAGKEGAQFKEKCKIAFRGPIKFQADPKIFTEALKMKFDRMGVSKQGEKAILIRFEKKNITHLLIFSAAE